MAERAASRPLASQIGIGFVVGYLVGIGALCPKCGHGTRVMSKRWARCKKCGERVARGFIPPASEGAGP